eukprot:820453-Rhodomonas_salina.1
MSCSHPSTHHPAASPPICFHQPFAVTPSLNIQTPHRRSTHLSVQLGSALMPRRYDTARIRASAAAKCSGKRAS